MKPKFKVHKSGGNRPPNKRSESEGTPNRKLENLFGKGQRIPSDSYKENYERIFGHG